MDSSLLGSIIEAASTIVGVVLGVALSIGAGIAIGRWQTHRRKLIEYEPYSASLLPKDGLAQPLLLMVDSSLLTGANTPGTMVPVKTAYSHTIRFTNVGDESITEPVFEVILDEHAFIAKVETNPEDSPNYTVTQVRDFANHNRLTIKVPYINRKQTIEVKTLSVQGQSGINTINVIGPNIEARLRSNERTLTPSSLFIFGFVLMACGAIILLLIQSFTLDTITAVFTVIAMIVALTSFAMTYIQAKSR